MRSKPERFETSAERIERAFDLTSFDPDAGQLEAMREIVDRNPAPPILDQVDELFAKYAGELEGFRSEPGPGSFELIDLDGRKVVYRLKGPPEAREKLLDIVSLLRILRRVDQLRLKGAADELAEAAVELGARLVIVEGREVFEIGFSKVKNAKAMSGPKSDLVEPARKVFYLYFDRIRPTSPSDLDAIKKTIEALKKDGEESRSTRTCQEWIKARKESPKKS